MRSLLGFGSTAHLGRSSHHQIGKRLSPRRRQHGVNTASTHQRLCDSALERKGAGLRSSLQYSELLNEIRLTNAAQLLAFSRDYPSFDQLAANERLGGCNGGGCKATARTNPAAFYLRLGHHCHFLAN